MLPRKPLYIEFLLNFVCTQGEIVKNKEIHVDILLIFDNLEALRMAEVGLTFQTVPHP